MSVLTQISDLFINYMMHLLDFLKSMTGNYGWAIIVFGALVKLALYPFTQKQYQSMKEMQKLQPEMKKLQEKYKNDQQKFQVETMALYKKYNVNPLGGCLPLLIQMPILLGIFVTIRKMAELGKFSGETFLWIGGPLSQTYSWVGASLADKDIPLLILYGISMFLSQKMTPAGDPTSAKTQEMMSYIMPVMFLFLLWQFPSSLILYWLVFNILSIVQQYFIMRETVSKATALVPATAPVYVPGTVPSIALPPGEQEREEAEVSDESSGSGRSRSRKNKGGKIR